MDAQAHTIASVLPTSNADPLLKPGLLSTAKSSSKNIVKIIRIVLNQDRFETCFKDCPRTGFYLWNTGLEAQVEKRPNSPPPPTPPQISSGSFWSSLFYLGNAKKRFGNRFDGAEGAASFLTCLVFKTV